MMKQPGCVHCDGGRLARRDFLRVGSLGLLGIGLGQYLQVSRALASQELAGLAKRKANACILLWLSGGAPQMDTFDPKPTSPFKPISTNVDGIQISDLFPRLSQHMDKLSIIRSMQTKETNHPQGTVEVMTGHRPNAGIKCPSLSTIICRELGPRNELPPNLVAPLPIKHSFAPYKDAYQSGFMDARYDPMFLPDPSEKDFELPDLTLPQSLTPEAIEDRREFLGVVDRLFRRKEQMAEFSTLDQYTEQALGMLLSPNVKKAFDLTQESDETKDAYGRNKVGLSALLSRRLVEAGARFVTVTGSPKSYADWDTHADNNKTMRESLGPVLDQTLPTLLEDLKQRGLLETTVVLVMGEFGRTPDINTQAGRDHYPDCWSMLLGGGGIEGGQVIGASDEKAAHPIERPTSMGEVFATVYKAFGIDYTKTYMTPVGRPIYIANGFEDQLGHPIPELI